MTNRERLIAAIKALNPQGEFTRADLAIEASKDSVNGSLKELCVDGAIRMCRRVKLKGGATNIYEVIDLTKRRVKPSEVVCAEKYSVEAWRDVAPELFMAPPLPLHGVRVIRIGD